MEDPKDARKCLELEGYVFWRGVVPEHLCVTLASNIERDIDRKLAAGSVCQEEPVEELSTKTAALLRSFQQWVLQNVLQPRLQPRHLEVPSWWPQTLYGRLKRRHFHTPWHCDALNTVVERKLLDGGEGDCGDAVRNCDAEEATHECEKRFVPAAATADSDPRSMLASCAKNHEGYTAIEDELPRSAAEKCGSEAFQRLPIFTFWVCLRSLRSQAQSHLRLHAGSHNAPNIQLTKNRRTGRVTRIAPRGYRYRSSNFLSPREPYRVGDLVLFHCLTQHEANMHNPHAASIKRAVANGSSSLDRVSMDGRVLMQLG